MVVLNIQSQLRTVNTLSRHKEYEKIESWGILRIFNFPWGILENEDTKHRRL